MSRQIGRERDTARPRPMLWAVLGGGLFAVVMLAFGLGLMVGRQTSQHAGASDHPSDVSKRAAVRRSGLTEPIPEHPATQEKLTFYQTLTAPLAPVAPAPKPDASPKLEAAAKAETAKPRPSAVERPMAPVPSGPVTATNAAAVAAPRPPRPVSPSAAVAPTPGDGHREWAVQVGAFRDRGPAESVRKPLADAGFAVYLTEVKAEGEPIRYKVRVGGFKSREEAARMAERIRQERSLTAFVTPR